MIGEMEGGLNAVDRMEGVPLPRENHLLVGHETQLSDLLEQHANGRLHHAFLVTGPRGIGKATFAYHAAWHLFCADAASPSLLSDPEVSLVKVPREDDPVFSRIARGGHPNLLTLSRPWDDKAKKFLTQLTVDEVRRTVSFFGTTAAEKVGRICIVDAADDLNRNAANAILKILEEPPANTTFFVLSHSPGRLLPTIRSRCQTIRLDPLRQELLDQVLKTLGIGQDLAEPDRLEIARLSEGSVRKAITLIEGDGLELYRQFRSIVFETGKTDWSSIHKLAGSMSARARDDRYQMFIELVMDEIARQVREPSNQGLDTSILARWAEVWEKTAQSASVADRYNLDRKQVILSLFKSLLEITK